MAAIRYIHIAIEIWGAIFCWIAVLCVYLTRHFDRKCAGSLISLLGSDALLNICEAMAYYYRGNMTPTGYVMVRVTNFTVFFCNHLLLIFASKYVGCVIEKRSGDADMKWLYAIYALCGGGTVLLILSRVFGFYYAFDAENRYYRLGGSYWIMIAIVEAALVILFIWIVKNRRYFRPFEFAAFLSFVLLPEAAIIIQLFLYGISIASIVNTVSIIGFFISNEMDYANVVVERERALREERERLLNEEILLEQERIRLYHSQIQAHFIYNSLTVSHARFQGVGYLKSLYPFPEGNH